MDNKVAKTTPATRVIVGRLLGTLKRVGTVEQQREADEIENLLSAYFSQPEVVNFAREETPATPVGKGSE